MCGITVGCEPRRHNRHQPPPGREALRGSDEMLGRDVLIPRPIDRRGEWRVHGHDIGQDRCLQQIVDMLTIVTCHLAPEDRAQEALAKRIDLVEQKRGACAGGESGQGASSGGWLQHGLALADRSRPHGQRREWQRRGELLQSDLLL